MADILSQNEIDELLNALSSGEVDVADMDSHKSNKKIKEYNFARPSKFSKEQLRTLEIIFDNYGRAISTFLSGYLRTLTQVEVINAEAVTYSEFTNSLTNPVVLSIIDFLPLNGSIILEFSPNMGYVIIDRILGGQGQSLGKIREYTEIEKILIERVIHQFINLLPEPWENVISLEPVLEKIETNSQVAQIISPNEIIALITFNVKIGNIEAMMNVCIPHMVIEPIMDKLNTRYWFAHEKKQTKKQYRHHIEKRLEFSRIPVSAILGRTQITVKEFIELQKNDIIALDSAVESDMQIHVGDFLKFYGKPGVHKNKNAIQITSVVRGEDDAE